MRKVVLVTAAVALAACGGPGGKLTGKLVVSGGMAGGITVTAVGPVGGGALTDGSGNFEIDQLADGNYSVSAVVPGTVEGEVRVFANVKGGKGDAPELKFTVPDPPPAPTVGVVTGKATYSDGSDASGITLTLLGPGSQGIAAAMDGTFTFNNVTPGVYTLAADAAESVERRITVAVNVTGNNTTDVGTLAFTATGTVTGKATKASGTTGNGGITVSVAGTIYRATTEDDGSYAIPGVPAGMQTVVASLPDWDPASTQVTVARGSVTAPNLNLTKLTVHGTVSGTVAFTNNQDRSIITISALGTGLSASAAADGRFTLQLPAGHFDIVATAPNFPPRKLGSVAVDDGTAEVLPTAVLSPWYDLPPEPGVTANPSFTLTADGDHAFYIVTVTGTPHYRIIDLRNLTMRTFLVGGTLPSGQLSRHGHYLAFPTGGPNWYIIDTTNSVHMALPTTGGAPTNNIATFTSDEAYFLVGDGTKVHRFEIATATDNPLTGAISYDYRNDAFLVRDVNTVPYTLTYATATTQMQVGTGVSLHIPEASGNTVVWNNCTGTNCAVHLVDQATGTISNPSGAYSLTSANAVTAAGSSAWIEFRGTTAGFMNVATGAFTVKPTNFGTYQFNPSGTALLYEITGAPNVLHYEAGAPTGAGTTLGTSTNSFNFAVSGRSGFLDDNRAIAFGNTPLARYDIVNGAATVDSDIANTGLVQSPVAVWQKNSDKHWVFAERSYADYDWDLGTGGLWFGACESTDGKLLFLGGYAPVGPAQYLTKVRNNDTGQVADIPGPYAAAGGVCTSKKSVIAGTLTYPLILVADGQRIDAWFEHSVLSYTTSSSLSQVQLLGAQFPVGSVSYPSWMLIP